MKKRKHSTWVKHYIGDRPPPHTDMMRIAVCFQKWKPMIWVTKKWQAWRKPALTCRKPGLQLAIMECGLFTQLWNSDSGRHYWTVVSTQMEYSISLVVSQSRLPVSQCSTSVLTRCTAIHQVNGVMQISTPSGGVNPLWGCNPWTDLDKSWHGWLRPPPDPILIKFSAHLHILNERTATWPKMKIFKFKMADGRHVENRFFGHNSAADCTVSLTFCMVKQNSMAIDVAT